MKKQQKRKLRISKVEIAKINTVLTEKLKGGTDTISIPGNPSAMGSQCGNQICL